MSSDTGTANGGIEATLAALRARGGDRRDPVRFRFIEALAQRAANRQGAARRVLEDKLTGLLAAYDLDEGAHRSVEPSPAVSEPAAKMAVVAPVAVAPAARVAPPLATPPRAAAGPLAELVHELAERTVPPPTSPRLSHGEPTASPRPAAAPAGALSAPPELKALSYFRSTWSRLSTEQRLAQSAAKLPENAGPLNSQHLVHQSLVLMRELSPGYLERFIAHIDALMWLDQLNSNGTAGK
jgi:hypothetical protein